MIGLLKKKAREFYDRFISLKGNPRSVAMGMAIGVFVGVTPTIPFHTVIILFLILISRQNLTAALLGAWITNPVTIPFFYFTEYELGRFLLGMGPCNVAVQEYSIREIIAAGWSLFYPLQVGGLVLAPFFAVPAYFITHKMVLVLRRRNHDRDGESKRPTPETWNSPA